MFNKWCLHSLWHFGRGCSRDLYFSTNIFIWWMGICPKTGLTLMSWCVCTRVYVQISPFPQYTHALGTFLDVGFGAHFYSFYPWGLAPDWFLWWKMLICPCLGSKCFLMSPSSWMPWGSCVWLAFSGQSYGIDQEYSMDRAHGLRSCVFVFQSCLK